MGRKTPPEFEITITELVFGGEGMGHLEKRPVFVYGVLPGERVLVRPVKVSSKFVKAAVVRILEPAPERRDPRNAHFLTSSPWEIMSEARQREYKKHAVLAMWSRIGGELPQPEVAIQPSPQDWGYRNKLEFSFCENESGELSLAFHRRYKFNQFEPLENSALAPGTLNECAAHIVAELRKQKIQVSQLKNLLLRYSFFEDKCIAVLYVKDQQFSKFVVTHPKLSSWAIVYSNPQSPAAITTRVLLKGGNMILTEKIGNQKFQYGYESFFQVNPGAFEVLMKWLRTNHRPGGTLLDLYAGVGTIGYVLADNYDKVISIEYNKEATQFAQKNADLNHLTNIDVFGGAAEEYDLPGLLPNVDSVVVDPPRSGLHPRVVEQLRDFGSKQIMYVSCNPSTQARDVAILSAVYEATAWELFDLYPQTPHIESVVVLQRK